jgi:hypothetical protein
LHQPLRDGQRRLRLNVSGNFKIELWKKKQKEEID